MLDLRKLFIIIKREYLTRVRTKAFIITTILIPIALLAVLAAPVLLQFMDSDTTYEIVIKDDTNEVYPRMAEIDSVRYTQADGRTIEELRTAITEEGIEGYIVITEEGIASGEAFELIYSGGGGITLVGDVQDDLRTAIREVRLERAEASDEIMAILETRPSLNTRKLTKEGQEEESNTFVLFAFGYGMAFIIYGAIFGYGSYVMRSVVEEKTNRIVEVVVSAVKPFELLLGKVLGIGALGVTQFVIWVIAGAGILSFIGPIAGMFMDPASLEAGQTAAEASNIPDFSAIGIEVGIYFIVFFLLGYLIYSAVLAAIGSAADSETDTQQLMIPVTIPVIFAIVMLPKVATDPDSMFSVVSSIIPFFSPILMIARIPVTDVPFWEIALSIVLMVVTFLGCLALGAKIYKTGILMYGKKASFKEIAKWIRQ